MGSNNLTIGFVRRGFSSSGGAEAYLKRLAAGVVENGHQVRLYASGDWPPDEWNFGPMTRVKGSSATAFADEIEKLAPRSECDVLMSLERIWRCDVYRAGDGVHRAWLERRAEMEGPLRKLSRVFNRKHSATIALEKSLFADGGARRVIANSQMVREEIVRLYGYPAGKIEVVPNGVPVAAFRRGEESRAKTRETLGLGPDDVAVLFAGSGWERKGLRFAIEAIERSPKQMSLLVAGRGEEGKFKSARARFLGVVEDMPALCGAADMFLLPTIYDPFSNACLEALAAGLPVVTTRANGFSEIIQTGVHGTLLDEPRNIDAIGEALLLWSGAARREQARPRIREVADRFDISANVARTLEIVTQVAATQRRNTDL
ncbi:MAG TPA: glycosyltransferase family 4 protein [Chthoniobacterales bacterium]|nr:glycosyltransferase family 4 protein [Chthoniobacterales bacterium]